jgi:hypothetical protein
MVGTHIEVDRCKVLLDYPNAAYLCMTVHGGSRWILSNLVSKVYNLSRVSIYSNSRVLSHRRLGQPLLSPMSVLILQKSLWKNWRRCRSEYSKGTAVARERFGVLIGYYQGNRDGHV